MIPTKLRHKRPGRLALLFLVIFLAGLESCARPAGNGTGNNVKAHKDSLAQRMPSAPGSPHQLRTAAERTGKWLHFVQGRSFGLVMHSASRLGPHLLYDSLVRSGLRPEKLFVPEHGLFSQAQAGEYISDGREPLYGIPVVSLYGSKKEPSVADLGGIEVLLFDLQDVGARFYTYLSTLHYVMQACARNRVHLVVLDRPNPNGCRLDGPVLDQRFSSFVGLHPVPILYGMSIGEYAQMVQGEGWIEQSDQLVMTVIPMQGYRHDLALELPVPPSPNLPNARSVWLYPSLCWFEGTSLSVGRGTPWPFQVLGHPGWHGAEFSFTPEKKPGSPAPLLNGATCFGLDLRAGAYWLPGAEEICAGLDLEPIIKAYKALGQGAQGAGTFFNPFFEKLAGTDLLRKQIMQGLSADQIRESWQEDLKMFSLIRQKYLLYE